MSSPSSRSTMFRQPAQRYQRARGLKVKHVLQIAIVAVVLTWVVYELSQSRHPGDSQRQDRSAYRDTVGDSSSFGRKALKPEGEQYTFHLEKDTATDPDDKSSLEENVDGSRTEEDAADDQRDKHISDLDIEHISDQGTFFEELKNEQARAEQEEAGEDDTEQDVDSQSLQSEVTTSSTEGRPRGASVVNGYKKAGRKTGVTFMESFNADSVLKQKLDKLDEGQVGDTSRAHVDEKLDSAKDALEEATEHSEQNVGEENNVDPNEEVSEKEVDDEASEVSTGNNADSQSEVEDTEVNLPTQSREQFDVNKEKPSVESKVKEKVETEEQKQAPEQQQVGGEEKPEDKHETLSHVKEEQEPEEKKQEEELVEKKANNTQTEVNDTESNIQPELKSNGTEVDISEKNGNQREMKESLKNVAGDLDSSTQGSQGETKSLVQSEETDENKRRLATEKSIQNLQGTSAEEKKEEAQQYHENGNESHQGNIEEKKDESAETNQVETDSKGAGDLSDDSNSKVEKLIQEDHSAETVNTDASKKEDSEQKAEGSKDEVLKQVTDSNDAGSEESDKKVED